MLENNNQDFFNQVIFGNKSGWFCMLGFYVAENVGEILGLNECVGYLFLLLSAC